MDNKEQKLETARAKLDIKRIKDNKVLAASKELVAGGVVSLAQGLENETMGSNVTEFFKEGAVKSLHSTLERNWLSQGKTPSGYVKDGVERI